MWSVFAVTRKDADISRVVFYGGSVWFDKLGLLVFLLVLFTQFIVDKMKKSRAVSS